jgi:tetratricopeptide (TPR) repeat protein
MKGLMANLGMLAVLCAALTVFAAAQGDSYGTVHGVCKDAQGNPIVGAEVLWKNVDNGRTYKLKTNKKGEYFSLGIEPGNYDITLSKDGKVLDQDKGFHVGVGELFHDFDLKQIQEQNIKETAKKEGVSAEQIRQQQAEAAKAQQFDSTVKAVNEKLNAASAMMKAQNYTQALATYQEAANMVPDQDVVWYDLGSAYLQSARAQSDATERRNQYTAAYDNIKKAIDLKNAALQKAGAQAETGGSNSSKAAKDQLTLAVYYDNLAEAASKMGNLDEAEKNYALAAQTDPTNAGRYYFNLGVTLYNNAQDEVTRKKAIVALDKAIAADPNKAEAYYLKGADLFAMVTTDSKGKMIAPPGTEESLQKYIELQPNGRYAEQAKGMLAALNTTVETGFGTKKGSSKKK